MRDFRFVGANGADRSVSEGSSTAVYSWRLSLAKVGG